MNFRPVGYLLIVLLASCLASLSCSLMKHVNAENDVMHEAILNQANAAVASKAEIAGKDSLRPIYHLMPQARLIGDPNAPVFYKGEYHLFFQHFPYWGESVPQIPMWGHAVSKDMVHWRNLPIALGPGPDTCDARAIASGCCVVHDNTPTIVYTGVDSKTSCQTQCLATSRDKLRTWQKDPANPVIASPPRLDGLDNGFRDPFVWREGNEWRMLLGSGYVKSKGGTVLLYRSTNLREWEYLGPMCEGMGERCFQWECPTFFSLADRHVLVVSPLFRDIQGLRGPVQYSVGTYQNNRFEPEAWAPIDLGGATVYYASTSFADQKDRRILWGFIMAGRPTEMGWSFCLSLPRVLTLASDSTLRYEPLPELKKLRRNSRHYENLALEKDKEVVLADALGLHGEVDIEIKMEQANRIELRVGRSPDGQGYIPLSYDKATGLLQFGDKKAAFPLDAGNSLRIRLFTDGMVAEAYLNEKACFSKVLPVTEQSVGLSIVATGGHATVARCRLWEMTSIWPK